VSKTLIRIADDAERSQLADLYKRWGYRAGIAPTDTVYVAEQEERIVGMVRRTLENGTTLLRGMQVDPEYQRRGIGSQLLQCFVNDLAMRDCYCIPYSHLTSFYEQGGFAVTANVAPNFVIERMNQYRLNGLDVLIMRRAAV
jgi:GNAT superfamily N-acetyltransferase